MKLTLSVSRKVGRQNYSSDGASCEVEIDLPAESTPQAIATAAVVWYQTIERCVEDELARLGGATVPPPAVQPNGHPERIVDRHPRTPAAASTGRQVADDDRPPGSGRELLGWARSRGLDSELKALAKSWNLGRILDASPEDVAQLHLQLDSDAALRRNGR